MIVDPRPYIIVKQLRVRDLRDDDIVRVYDTNVGEHRWLRWEDAAHAYDYDDVDLLMVQALEAKQDPPPVPVMSDPAYRDALRGGTP